MLRNFRESIESRLERTINNAELAVAIELAKSDVVMNDLIFGKGVTAEQFEDVVVKCLQAMGRCAG
ncbi:hypothetical protein [Acetivibrio straminisolvens]|jgi:hypothetical protein|uniref:hypothetical protein n=1 Tax=Acetivibrio straminisolvens TaxID=253314 RepID=UPI00223FA128|nr:hypothetical protein [Acetivibrio straminisolvens]